MFGWAVWLAVLEGIGGGDAPFEVTQVGESSVPACLTSWAFPPGEPAAAPPAAPRHWKKLGGAPALRLRAARAPAPAAR